MQRRKGRKAAIIVCGLIAGCVGLPDQKLQDGVAGCVTVNSMYGKASSITIRADNVPKGMSNTEKMVIKCGDNSMEIDTNRSVPPPAPVQPVGK